MPAAQNGRHLFGSGLAPIGAGGLGETTCRMAAVASMDVHRTDAHRLPGLPHDRTQRGPQTPGGDSGGRLRVGEPAIRRSFPNRESSRVSFILGTGARHGRHAPMLAVRADAKGDAGIGLDWRKCLVFCGFL
jgi:hypothetical protein